MIPLFKKGSNPNKILFDIQSASISQSYKEGIKQYQINTNRICKHSNPKLFISYRREKIIQDNGDAHIHDHSYI